GGRPRASPSNPPAQAPHGVGCGQSDSHEHERPDARLRVQPFAATYDPAATTASADFSAASSALSSAAVASHPTNAPPGAVGPLATLTDTSRGKTSHLP